MRKFLCYTHFNNKIESRQFSFIELERHIKKLLTLISVDIRIYLAASVNITFKGRQILMSTSLKSIIE